MKHNTSDITDHTWNKTHDMWYPGQVLVTVTISPAVLCLQVICINLRASPAHTGYANYPDDDCLVSSVLSEGHQEVADLNSAVVSSSTIEISAKCCPRQQTTLTISYSCYPPAKVNIWNFCEQWSEFYLNSQLRVPSTLGILTVITYFPQPNVSNTQSLFTISKKSIFLINVCY